MAESFRDDRLIGSRVMHRWQRYTCSGLLIAVSAGGLSCSGDGNAVDPEARVPSPLETTAPPMAGGAGAAGLDLALAGAVGVASSPGSSTSGGSSPSPIVADAGAASIPLASDMSISEVKFDPAGVDGNYEFVELRGRPGTSLAAQWLVAVEGDAESNRGQIDVAIDLSNCGDGVCQFDEHGLLLLVPDPVATVPPIGSALRLSNEIAKGSLENGTTTLLVLQGTCAGAQGLDWDSDDDGTLELPPGVSLLDSVAWTDGGADDLTYAEVTLGPKPKPQAVWSCGGDSAPTQWRYGQLLGEPASLTVDVIHVFPEGLTAFDLTPGLANTCQPLSQPSTPVAQAGTAGTSGATSAIPNAGCGGIDSVGGSGGFSRGGSSTGDAQHGGGTPTAAAGLPGVQQAKPSPSIAGGLVPAPLQTNKGGSAASSAAIAGCGGAEVQVIPTPAISNAGSPGWWSPLPFLGAAAGQANGPNPQGAPGTGGAKSGSATHPAMPSGCAFRSRPRGPLGTLLVVGWWLAAALRRRSASSRAS